ncbi:hypothetical protein [Paracoccus pacificus]|uniref:Lipoprotein n=1 Tax=Paracoccus pacificus TaxID=1463598 RepID=A0ABW4R5Q4_9RHOB
MQKRTVAIAMSLLAAAGCTTAGNTAAEKASPYPIPEQVVAIAGPNQDLTTARLDPADNCYWYYYAGPVETTLVPLRAANGNQICKVSPT